MRKSRRTHLYAKRFLSFMMAVMLLASTCGTVHGAAEQGRTRAANDLTVLVNPVLQEYVEADETGTWKVTDSTRFVVDATAENMNNARLQEVVKLMNSEYCAKSIPSGTPRAMVFAGQQTAADIFIQLADVAQISTDTQSNEAYSIEIGKSGVVVKAASENAVLYALQTILQLMMTNDGLPYGKIVDYPTVAERRLHVDCARKYISKDWFIRQIREMSWMKMNAIQIHFSENLGFRLQCDTDPSIVSEQYLTKDEMREVLEEAKKYGLKVIPSFDSPGHVDQILKVHPEYGQVNSYGNHYASGLDVTNPQAVNYIRSLYQEYLDFFKPYASDFHIGGDEYMEFDRAPFTTQYQSVLNNYAVQKYGSGYTWKDVISGYINDLAEFVHDNGYTPRIWNDGIYYGESSSPQKIVMHDYIGIDFWSQMSWNWSIAKLQTFINKGHDTIYNINASYFYYVLRNDIPTDGREQHSFDVLNQDQNIYNNWTPGQFQGNTIADDSPVIKGAAMAIWCDNAGACTEDVITDDIASAMRSLAGKSWNTDSNRRLNWSGFSQLCATLGNAPGFAKGSVLPTVGEFVAGDELGKVTVHYQDAEGSAIKADRIVYGALEEAYTVEADAIYGYRVISDASVSGTYTKADQEVTFVYEVYCDKSALQSEVDAKVSEETYIPQTYAEYKDCLKRAEAILANDKATQTQVDEIKDELIEAKTKIVLLSKLALYVEVISPKAAAGYTENSYATYSSALEAGKAVLYRADASNDDVNAALTAILNAKRGLQPKEMLIVTSSNEFYVDTGWGGQSYPLSNMIDGNLNTKAWITGDQKVDDWIQFSFRVPVDLRSIRLQSPTDAGEDYLHWADVEVSANGETWDKVATWEGSLDKTVTFDETRAQYLRLRVTTFIKFWTQISEATLGYTVPEDADKAALAALVEEVLEMDFGQYTIESVSPVTEVLVNATEVLNHDGASTEEVENAKTALEGAVAGLVIIPADYSAVNAAIAEADTLVKNQYTADTWDELMAAVDAVVEGKSILEQAEVTAMADRIHAAIAALAKAPADIVKNKYVVKVDGVMKGQDLDYNAPFKITAEPQEGKEFAGWKVNGEIVSLEPTYSFYVANDIEFETVYKEDERPVKEDPKALMSNVIVTDGEGKSDVKFVGQLVIPKEYTLKNAGLVWSTKTAEQVQLIVEQKLNPNLKPTLITKISESNQFSVTIKGLPNGMSLRGAIFATLVDSEGNEILIYSGEKKAVTVQ